MYDPKKHHRRSVRLRGYDYSQPGEYFVTLCTHSMQLLFGRIADGRMEPNAYGAIAAEEWRRSRAICPEIELDEWVVMPNHIHGIIRILDRPRQGVGAHGHAPVRRAPRSLGSFVAGFKSAVKLRINALRHTPGTDVWQRNYYDHIVSSPRELDMIRDYIRHNPLRWACDRLNPDLGLLVDDGDGRLEKWM
jgi:putative transposase